MTLSFSTKWPDRMGDLAGQPNYFPYKILDGLFIEDIIDYDYQSGWIETNAVSKPIGVWTRSKYHTIREDKHNRWKPGMDIHMVINNRTKDRFQFAPVVKCVSVQEICITYYNSESDYPAVKIGKNVFHVFQKHGAKVIEQLAQNDGFPSIEAFFQYFNSDFRGKLIHWTDLKY